MSKNVIINQDKLVVLKEALDEFMVDKNSKVADHDYVWFILYRGDLLFFDDKNKNLLDDFFHRHQDELGDFVYSYENSKYKAGMNFDGFVDFLGSSIPYLITGYVSRGNEVYINKNENYDVLNSNELFQFVKDMPNSKFYFDGKELDRNDILHNKGKKMPTVWYHGTTFEYALDILGNGLRAKPEKSLYKIKHDKTVFMSSNFRQAKWYAEYKSRRSYGSWANKPCVLKIDGSKIDSNKIVYDYDVYNAHAIDRNDSVYNDRMGELGLTYDRISQTITKPTDPRKYMKVGYRGIIMPNAITSVYLVSYNGDTEMTPTDFVKYINDTYVGFDKDDMKLLNMNEAAPEVDEYEIGAESDNPPVGGNGYHINESASFDSSEIGAVNYSWDFDEDEYQEWLQEAEYENTQESLMEYINDNVEFELEYLDNETYHTCGTEYVDYDTLEDMFGSKMQNEILTTCMNDGSGSFETVNLYSDDDVDVNSKDSVNNMAMKLLRHGDYFKDCRGFILTNGVVVYTESEHNEICRIPNINNKFDFIRMGNIRVLPQSIDIGDKPTSEQRDVLRRAIACYADEELYLDIYQGKSSIGTHYIHPDWRYVIGEIDRFYSEGIKPQGNEYYESKNSKKQIVENKYDDLFNKANYDLQYFLKQGKEKYGLDGWYISSWMEKTHPEISVDPKDIKIYTALSDKLHKITKLWTDENNKEESEKDLEQSKENYDIISLAIEEFGLTSRLSQAGFILPDGKLLNFGSDGYRETDHRQIAAVYKQNGIKIWNDEYRYNYVVDFMNHGAIRCDVNSGILDMTKEPTNEQFYAIKDFVRKAVDVDIDFTDDKGNTLHSVSYSDAKPQAVVADIRRYYEDGIKPMGNVQYEANNNEKHIVENFDFEVDSSEIDLSSFKKKHELVPNIWKPDGKLDSRIRLKLLDIADDFWKYVNLTWVEPSGIILTGSICNFNWSQYSDIDLHLIVDFDEIDEKTEFVRDYLDAKKNEWNNEHSGLQIMGYQVELYVQNLGEMPESNGIYDLEENDWIKEPNPDDIKSIGLNKFSIKDKAAKIMTIIDDMYDALASTDDSHQIEEMGDDASYLWKKVKNMRKKSLEKNGESGSGNIVYKILRRTGYLDRLFKLSNVVYDKSNSITESKNIIKEYLEKDYNLPLYKYFKWASTASSCEKARDLAYSCSYYIGEYIEKIYFRYSEFENLLDDDEFDYEDEEKVETFCKMLEENNLCDHFVSTMQDIVNTHGYYNELPSWCHMDFNRIVKNEWCIHFGADSESIAKEGFTGGTEELEHLAYTNAGTQKSSAGYDFAFLINDRSVDYNEYGDEAVIFRTSGIEVYHYGDNQNQVIFWGPNVKSFIPIHQDNGDWVVYGQNGQVLVRKNEPSEIALWATENLPQYRKQIMTGKNGYTPKQWVYNKELGKSKAIPYPIYRNESVKKYLTLLKENFINEEWVGDGNSEHNPYKKRWDAERKALKDFLSNYGKLMQSKENGKLYKCYYDRTLSQLIGYNYCICIQWDNINMKPKSVLYIRALDKFTPNIKQVNFDARGHDNVMGSYDDRRF